MKLIEVQAAKEFASTYLNDIFFKMAVNSVLDAAPGFDLVQCKDCKHFTEGMAVGMCKRDAEHPIMPVPYDNYCGFGERKANE